MSLLRKILKNQLKMYNNMNLQDVYKLLYQGTFGCEHSVDETSRELFYEEYEAAAEPKENEKLVELISPRYSIYRINIRPYKDHGMEKEILFEWFHESSKIQTGSIPIFLGYWKKLKEEFLKIKNIPEEELEKFEKIIKEEYDQNNKLPIFHHSKEYNQVNNPNYRVVNRKTVTYFMKKMLTK